MMNIKYLYIFTLILGIFRLQFVHIYIFVINSSRETYIYSAVRRRQQKIIDSEQKVPTVE